MDNKWSEAKAAAASLLSSHGQAIRFGLTLFPKNDSCGDGRVSVELGDDDANTLIMTELDSTFPGGKTPLGDTLGDMAAYPPLADSERENFVLLLSDGADTCDGHPGKHVEKLFAQGVRTYVVGFKGGEGNTLNKLAIKGGTARPGDGAKYYKAKDGAELESAFLEIATQASRVCEFPLQAQEGELLVYFDGSPILDGWSFDATEGRLRFSDDTCDVLPGVGQIDVEFSCPDPVD